MKLVQICADAGRKLLDAVLPPSAADGMEKIIPDLEKYLVRDSGHWTQQEKPEEVSAKLIEWRRKRFG